MILLHIQPISFIWKEAYVFVKKKTHTLNTSGHPATKECVLDQKPKEKFSIVTTS